jgi:hypothetical protein
MTSRARASLAMWLCGAVTLGAAQNDEPSQRKNEEVDTSLRGLTLPEAARQLGRTIVIRGNVTPLERASSLDALARISELVCVGSVRAASSVLTVDERSIVTFNDLQIGRLYKGTAGVEPKRVSVVLPGGRVEFGRGLAAEVRPMGQDPLIVGQRYAVFLKRLESDDRLLRSTSESVVYRLTLGAQSVFHLTDQGVIGPQSFERELIKKYEGTPVDAFLALLARNSVVERR